MELLAHRGDTSNAIGNTLEAFQAAYDADADGFEFDIRLTSDDVPIVYHNMMIADVFVSDLSYSDLKAIQLTNDKDLVSYIPSLVEVLDQFAGKTYLEMHLQSDTRETVHEICKLIDQYPQLNDMYELTTFEPAIINIVHSYKQTYPCDLLFRIASWMTEEIAIRLLIDKSKLAKPRGVHLFPHQITSEVLSRFEELDLVVHCGVTNDVALYEQIHSLGVSQILTDDIHVYLKSS